MATAGPLLCTQVSLSWVGPEKIREKKKVLGAIHVKLSPLLVYYFSVFFFRHPQDSTSWNIAQGKHYFGEFSEQCHSPILFATTVVVHNEVRVSAISDNPKREVALLWTELVMWLVPEWATIDDITSNLEIQKKKYHPSERKKEQCCYFHPCFWKQIKFANVIGTSSKKDQKNERLITVKESRVSSVVLFIWTISCRLIHHIVL